MKTKLMALAILFVSTCSMGRTVGGNQDSTSLGGISASGSLVFTQTSSSGCPTGYDGEIMHSRSVVNGVAEAWRETYRSCREGFYQTQEDEARIVSCPPANTGSITEIRTNTYRISRLTGLRTLDSSSNWTVSINTCQPLPPTCNSPGPTDSWGSGYAFSPASGTFCHAPASRNGIFNLGETLSYTSTPGFTTSGYWGTATARNSGVRAYTCTRDASGYMTWIKTTDTCQ